MDTPISSTQAPVLPPAPVLLPAHHIRWKLISAIFVVALFAGFEAYYFINKSVAEEVIPVFTPRPTLDPTASWKTYWNKQYGFEVKYPSDWLLTENSDKQVSLQSPSTLEKIRRKDIYPEYSTDVVIKYFNSTSPINLINGNFLETYLTIDGRPGKEYSFGGGKVGLHI